MQNIKGFFEFIGLANRLKETYRFSEVPKIRGTESSADHSWRLALAAIALHKELKLALDMEKALKIAIIHDLAEAITGDIDIRLLKNNEKKAMEKHDNEKKAMELICKSLSKAARDEIQGLWREYEGSGSKEAKYIKALDKIEGLMHLEEKGGFDDAELIGMYGNNAVLDFPELLPVFRELKKRLKAQCIGKGLSWRAEYEI
jgi:putative hydrolases of HD superfamily